MNITQSEKSRNNECLIVGVGASAGGLDAFAALLKHVPAASGMAFVLVQHLDPEHRSMLVELLGKHTSLPIVTAADNLAIEADYVYVIPPDSTLTVADGRLRLDKPAPPREQRRPVDALFMSLARDQQEYSACVVLAGTGSDGTQGARAIKAHGGLVLVQAESDHTPLPGMPSSAAATGCVDDILPVEDIPAWLSRYRQRPGAAVLQGQHEQRHTEIVDYLETISQLLHAQTGHDFSEYKDNTRVRRIQRRMQVLNVDTVTAYVERLEHDLDERDALFQEMLIGVTRFFRDPEAWQTLSEQVIEPLLEEKNTSDTIRVWCPGSGTGEEAYTVAMLFQEALEGRDAPGPGLQIFATDIDPHAVHMARTAWYGADMPGLGATRCRRWFSEDRGGYRPTKIIRDRCIFSPHDLDRDPPFSRLDLVACRNVLIYMSSALQDRILSKFHYALRPGGVLFLGLSESVNRQASLFEAMDGRHHLFRRRDAIRQNMIQPSTPALPASSAAQSRPVSPPSGEHDLEQQIRRAMAPYSPAYLIIDRQRAIQRFSGGPAGAYLEPSDGVASFNLFDLVKKVLRPPMRDAVDQALAANQTVIREGIVLHVEGQCRLIQLVVAPLTAYGDPPALFVVAFRDRGPADGETSVPPTPSEPADTEAAALQQELQVTRTQLHAALAELETTREEAKSATEEYQSINEELQSSNEELETSKEEMQSVNEELQTINAELDSKNRQLTRLNSDLRNLLESTRIATLFLDDNLQIRNFTPEALTLFQLRDSDRGRPITELVSQLNYDDLAADVHAVLKRLTTIEREVTGKDGTIYIMHIRLYRTVANVIEGVVVTFFDITEHKRYERQLAWLATVVDASRDAIISEGPDGRVTSWNRAAERIFSYESDKAMGRPLDTLLADNLVPALPRYLERRRRTRDVSPIEAKFTHHDDSVTHMSIVLSAITDSDGRRIGTALVAHDMTEWVADEQHRRLLVRELSHRVKNVLATVQSVMLQTLEYSDSLAVFGDTFSKRLQALADTHTELLRSNWQGARLDTLVEIALRPYGDPAQPPWALHGPEVGLAPGQAIAVSMALHELATNAAKYGALSTDEGQVDVKWTLQPAGGELEICWREQSGPPVTSPARHNFGLRLINEGLAHELDARVDLAFQPEGLVCRIAFCKAAPPASLHNSHSDDA